MWWEILNLFLLFRSPDTSDCALPKIDNRRMLAAPFWYYLRDSRLLTSELNFSPCRRNETSINIPLESPSKELSNDIWCKGILHMIVEFMVPKKHPARSAWTRPDRPESGQIGLNPARSAWSSLPRNLLERVKFRWCMQAPWSTRFESDVRLTTAWSSRSRVATYRRNG